MQFSWCAYALHCNQWCYWSSPTLFMFSRHSKRNYCTYEKVRTTDEEWKRMLFNFLCLEKTSLFAHTIFEKIWNFHNITFFIIAYVCCVQQRSGWWNETSWFLVKLVFIFCCKRSMRQIELKCFYITKTRIYIIPANVQCDRSS